MLEWFLQTDPPSSLMCMVISFKAIHVCCHDPWTVDSMLTCTYSVALTPHFWSQLTDTTAANVLNAHIHNHYSVCSNFIPYSYLKPWRRGLCWLGMWWAGHGPYSMYGINHPCQSCLGIVFQCVPWASFSLSKNWYIVFMHVHKEFDHLFDISEPLHLLLFNNGLPSKRKKVYGKL